MLVSSLDLEIRSLAQLSALRRQRLEAGTIVATLAQTGHHVIHQHSHPDHVRSHCGAKIFDSERYCSTCEKDAGFINVRAANHHDEKSALEVRGAQARLKAEATGCGAAYDDFVRQVATTSQVVISRNIAVLDNLLTDDQHYIISYHRQLESGSRIPEENRWDKNRVAAEQVINPYCYKDIIFGALSLDGLGVLAYGKYSILETDSSFSPNNVF